MRYVGTDLLADNVCSAVDALAEGSGMAGRPRKRRDLGDIAGTWQAEKAVESALAAQDRVDDDLWR